VARIVALAAALAGLAGCDLLWNWSNRDGLRRDVVELLGRHGVIAQEPACAMLGTTRTGACRLRAEPTRRPGLVRGLGLTAVAPGDPDVSHWAGEGGCRDLARVATVYRSARRPAALRLPNGSAFEYLLLYQAQRGDDVCVQVAYAYG
jgi:hypothetical protein